MTIGRIILVVGLFLLLGFLISLGQWQLRRAEEKTLLFDQIAAAESLPAVTIPVNDPRLGAYRYRSITLRGRYDSARQLLLDNMTHQRVTGYYVLTLFRPLGSEYSVIVNRGWVPAGPDRRVLPRIPVDGAVRDIRGQVDSLPRPGLQLAPAKLDNTASWPKTVIFPTIDDLELLLDEPLFDHSLWLSEEEPDGFVRQWEPRVMAAEQHIGYAIQWFGLAGVLVVMTIVLAVSSTSHHREA